LTVNFIVIVQSCTDLLSVVPSSCCETCLPSSDDGSEVIKVKLEDVGVREEDVPVLSLAVKAEHEVSYGFVCPPLDSFLVHLELPLVFLNSLYLLAT
jgi:hypothetical protein